MHKVGRCRKPRGGSGCSCCSLQRLSGIYLSSAAEMLGCPWFGRSEKQPDDLVFWLFLAVLRRKTATATCHHRKVVSGSSKSHHDITINNICQFDNKPLVDQRCGARCVIRDMPAAGTERYRWTVTVIGEPTRVPRRSRAAAKIPKAVGFTQSYAVAKRERRDDRPRQRDRGQP